MKGLPGKLKSGRGGLLLICLVFVASATMRIAGGTGPAVAKELSALPQGFSAERSNDLEIGNCAPEARIRPVLQTLKDRSTELDRQETTIATRLQTLKLAEEEIQHNLAALIEAEDRLLATIALADGAADADIDRLTEVYQKMNPKEAAALFEAMDASFSAGFLSRMRPESAAEIMAGLTPATAYTISIVLAGRNSAVPRE